MGEHYFTGDPGSAHDEREIPFSYRGKTLKFVTDAGTFSRDGVDKGSALLLRALDETHGRVLDVGCGWGAMAVSIASAYPACSVFAVDINTRAVSLAQKNAALNGVANVITCVSDGFERVEGLYDTIVINPPIRAGKAVVYALFEGCASHLAPGGALLVVIRKQQGAESAQKKLNELFSSVERIARDAGFWVLKCVHRA